MNFLVKRDIFIQFRAVLIVVVNTSISEKVTSGFSFASHWKWVQKVRKGQGASKGVATSRTLHPSTLFRHSYRKGLRTSLFFWEGIINKRIRVNIKFIYIYIENPQVFWAYIEQDRLMLNKRRNIPRSTKEATPNGRTIFKLKNVVDVKMKNFLYL